MSKHRRVIHFSVPVPSRKSCLVIIVVVGLVTAGLILKHSMPPEPLSSTTLDSDLFLSIKIRLPNDPLWVQALLCPYVHAVHLSMRQLRAPLSTDEKSNPSIDDLRERLLRDGPMELLLEEKQRLLWDADTVFWLHQQLWSRPDAELHPSWKQLHSNCKENILLQQYLTVA